MANNVDWANLLIQVGAQSFAFFIDWLRSNQVTDEDIAAITKTMLQDQKSWIEEVLTDRSDT